MKVLVVEWIISLPKATRIIRFFEKKKKHSNLGYSFEIEELPCLLTETWKLRKIIKDFDEKMFYSEKKRYMRTSRETAFRLQVYREVEVNRSPEPRTENETLRLQPLRST